MARKKPGRYDAGVNGLHGHSARAPVDDGVRPGKLSRKLTTTTGRGKSRRGVRGCTSGSVGRCDGLAGLLETVIFKKRDICFFRRFCPYTARGCKAGFSSHEAKFLWDHALFQKSVICRACAV